jgi:outer membrane protein assembly factor BamB
MTVLDENTGITLWTNNYAGSPTSAAYTPDIVVLEYLEGTISALDPASGLKRWQKMGSCVGGGGEVPVIYQGRIYARDYGNYPNVIYDLKTGDEIGYFNASTVPAFENGMGFFLNIGTLEGHDLSGTLKWTFVGDGNLSSTPMAAGGAVYIGSTSGSLFAVDEKTGTQLWEEKLDAPIEAANEMDGLWPTVGLGASYDLLVVPASGVLAVYGN